MMIPIDIRLPQIHQSDDLNISKLPPQLARLGGEQSGELVLLEMQGSLEVEGTKDGQVIGTLSFDQKDKPTMRIGHHLLEGKLVALPKPLAVLHSNNASKELSDPNGMDVDAPSATDGSALSTQAMSWAMVALVKRKIVFSKRPMPIVGASATAAPK